MKERAARVEQAQGAQSEACPPAAFRWNAALVALYRRLIAAGKLHKVALVACARKLIIYVNTVVERGTPWTSPARPRQVDALRRRPDRLAGAERAH